VALSKPEAGGWQERIRYKRRVSRALRIIDGGQSGALNAGTQAIGPEQSKLGEAPHEIRLTQESSALRNEEDGKGGLLVVDVFVRTTLDGYKIVDHTLFTRVESFPTTKFIPIELEPPIPWERHEDENGIVLAERVKTAQLPKTRWEKVINFLKKKKVLLPLLGAGAAAVYGVTTVGPALNKNSQELQKSRLETRQFVNENEEKLSRVDFGTTFTPEIFASPEQAMEALRTIHEELNINDIRFGIRWENAVDANGNIDLGYYKPFLDYMIANKINITLSYGPDKNPTSPETFESEDVLNSINVPENGGVITKDSQLAKAGFEYIKKLFAKIRETYTQEQLEAVKIIQAQNEPFQSFGERGWTIDKEYLKQLIFEGLKTFPNANVLVNSAGTLNVDAVLNLFEELIAGGVKPEKLTFGWDIYTDIPDINTPIGKADILNPPAEGQMGPLTWDEILAPFGGILAPPFGGGKFALVEQKRKEWSFMEEDTELQGKGWKNSNFGIQNFQYGLQQALDVMPSDGRVVIRLWDIEALLQGYAKDSRQIFEIVAATNPKNSEKVHAIIPKMEFQAPRNR
jgi:hypothetical protein